MASFLKERKILKREGDEYKPINPEEHLAGKVVALYFSAHWCPPCRQFTPILKDFYEALIDSDKPFEIIFVSFDRSEEDLKSYMHEAHGNWCTFAFGDPSIKELADKYHVNGIPALIVINDKGDSVSENGRADVQGGAPDQTFARWKTACGL